MRVLVTGNLGYIGVVVTATLQAAGHQVVGLDTDYFFDGTFGYPQAHYSRPLGGQIEKDVRDFLPSDLKGIEAIVHLAALSNDPMGELEPMVTQAVNYQASVDLARAARNAGVSRFLFSSSCSVYGQGEGQALSESSALHPLTAYARSKAATETDIARLAGASFSPVFLRNATAYGLSPMLRFDLVVNNLTGWAVTTGQVKLLSDGSAWRPIVHVGDIAQAFLAALEAPRAAVHNQVFNVGCDQDNYQVRQIAEAVADVMPECAVTFGEGAGADNRTYNVSFAKIREQLPGFQPRWSLPDGIRELYEACRAHALTADEFQGRQFTRLKQLNYLRGTDQLELGPALAASGAGHMKAVILAGGLGSRLQEETVLRPKPMVEIGGKPILWHIMNIYASQGVCEFVIALGYKAEVIKQYFINYYAINNDISVDLGTGRTTIHDGHLPNWKIHLVDTGLSTQTGGRLKRLRSWLCDDEPFMFTYGDGVADIDIQALLQFHRQHGKLATVTTVRAPERFGRISFEGDQVAEFFEKPEQAQGWINGGFFVLQPQALDYVQSDSSVWERDAISSLARNGQLVGYRHGGFWSCMDTLKEKNTLEELWAAGQAPWRVWQNS